MIVASIDIGTNTVLLLIAKVDLGLKKIFPLVNEYRMPRIGRGVKKSKLIVPEKIESLLSVLDEYKGIIENYKCDRVILSGTNALRLANNSNSIIELIKQKYNYDLNVITGEQEAEFAYLGAISGIENSGPSMVIDIGGSSTEFIYGDDTKIIFKKSLQLGSVSSTEQFLLHSPPLFSEIEELNSEIKKSISLIDPKIIPQTVIAIAGTATTICSMVNGLKEFSEVSVDNSKLGFKDLKNLISELKLFSKEDIIKIYGSIMKGREDIILAGACILFQIMESFEIQKVTVSTRGIRYGAIINFMNNK